MAVNVINRQKHVKISGAALARLLEKTIAEELGRSADMNVLITDDEEIARLNKQYLGHDGPTDVLAFGMDEEDGSLLGDVAVSAETATRVGPQHDNSPRRELTLYAVHGTLHLLGYDDIKKADRRKMWARQDEIMSGVSGEAKKGEKKESGC